MNDSEQAHGTAKTVESPHWLDWAPLGLWSAGALALLRLAALRSIWAQADLVDESELLGWNLAGQFLPSLGQALVVGLASAALLSARRVEEPERFPAGPFLFVALLFASVLSGWPLAPASQRSTLLFQPVPGDLAVQLVAATLGAFLLWHALGLAQRRGPGRLLAGRLGLGLAFLTATLTPAACGLRAESDAPTFARRVVDHDFLEALSARPDSIEMVEGPSPARVDVITPVVAWEVDAGDKPALLMTPPSTARFRVPQGDGPGALFLRAAAGLHKSLYDHMPEGVQRFDVEFAIQVNGETAFDERVTCERNTPGVWDPSKRVWHHAGDGGIAVEAGDEITLTARLSDPTLLERIAPEKLRLGFGGLFLEREIVDERSRATPESPNIVLIVMDTLRADRMSCYGYKRRTTPRIDDLAARGILFENGYSTSSWTWPATASILTGLPADAHGVTSNESCTLVRSIQRLPEVLQERGFKTAGFSCNPLIAAERYFDQGFEDFVYTKDGFWMTDEIAPDILDWMDTNRGVRFFLYLHLADPHIPHRPHAEEAKRLGLVEPSDLPEGRMAHYENSSEPIPAHHQRWISDVYDASVATGDRWVGEFLDRLEALGLRDRTIVAFTADHGEELLDRGKLGHGHTLHQELVNVPLIVAGPGIPAGVRLDSVVSNRHLAPTLAQLGGGDVSGMGDGVFLLEEETAQGGSAFLQTVKGTWGPHRGQLLYGLRKDDLLLQWRDAATDVPELKLFDLKRAPDGTLEIGAEGSEEAGAMLTELQAQLEEQREFKPEASFEAGAGGTENLEQIGYIGKDEDDE